MIHCLDGVVSRETIDKLEIYRSLLIEWNRQTSLVQNKTFDDFWTRHVKDSLQLMNFINSTEESIGDIGSGAGFPAMVLAIAGFENVTLIESNQRKTFFLEEVARRTGTHVHILHARVEELSDLKFSTLTSRACASLPVLLDYALRSVSRETLSYCLFMKGANWEKEVEQSAKEFIFSYEAFKSQTDSEGKILKIRNIHRIGER